MASWEDIKNHSDEDEDSKYEAQIYFMAGHDQLDEICLASKKKKDMWYLDSGCSRHMTRKSTFFVKPNMYNGRFVTFGDDGKANESLCADFGRLMTSEFDMSMMGKPNFVLGLQIKQTPNRTFIHLEKYANELVKKFGIENAKPMDTFMHPNSWLEKGETEKDVDETRYER
ncbi:uncharacterized protein LOC107465516 [Arachis duranensis]|uniref:Uncharacterized protein LOC107465516 n=1 Tax=Arachis duranensis TaxID=130453 RepID=A0A6P4BHL1_ARADU|nr:uncharacterized protein LOC107465516 [Arachis duranensis]